MADPVSVRMSVVIIATVGAVALAAGFGSGAILSPSTANPCSSLYEGGVYCTQTMNVYHWCHEPAPCPYFGNSTTLLGYQFNVFPLITPNGTPGLEMSVLGPNEPGTGVLLLSNPIGAQVTWTSSDGLLLVVWPSPPPSWESPLPDSTHVICGVAGA